MYNGNHNYDSKKYFTVKKLILIVLFTIFISAFTIFAFMFLLSKDIITLPNSIQSRDFTDDINNKSNSDNADTVNIKDLSLQQVAKNVIPSVVGVQTYSDNNAANLIGEGSGVVLTQDGYIITNAHVIKGGGSYKIILFDGKTYSAELVGSDTATDIALLKADATNLTTAKFASSNNTQVGDIVLAIGNPGGVAFNSTTTMGIISATNRSITTSSGYILSCIQTDAAISPGNSGGALVNTSAEVIGISSSKIVASGFEGLGFAITSEVALSVADDLKNYGYVKNRAALGVTYQFVDEATSKFYDLPTGMFIHDIKNNSIKKAGLKKGDIITHIDNTKLKNITDVTQILMEKKPNDKVKIKVYRSSDSSAFSAEIELIESK